MSRQSWWDEDESRERRLREMVAEGLSFSAIARALGTTRSAAIGKANRVGLSARARSTPNVSRAERRQARDRAHDILKAPMIEPMPAFASSWRSTPRPVKPYVEPDSGEVPLVTSIGDLEDHHCRWPIGDPRSESFGYCGHRKVRGMPYCEAHCRVAYAVPENEAVNGVRIAAGGQIGSGAGDGAKNETGASEGARTRETETA